MAATALDMKALNIPLPPEAKNELVIHTEEEDDRMWVPRGEGVWFRPLMYNVTQGSWVNLTRATREGVIGGEELVADDGREEPEDGEVVPLQDVSERAGDDVTSLSRNRNAPRSHGDSRAAGLRCRPTVRGPRSGSRCAAGTMA